MSPRLTEGAGFLRKSPNFPRYIAPDFLQYLSKDPNKRRPKTMKRNQLMKNRNIVYAVILFWLVCFGLSQSAQAVAPAPDDGNAGGNTAEGNAAVLLSLTADSYNTAIDLFSLSSNTDGNFNTAIGAGALLANTSAENTTTGVRVPLSDTIVFLLVLPWLVRALASAKAIWRLLMDGQKSERKKERHALAHS
jgi:hypothetical protein